MLKVRDLVAGYGEIRALNGVNLDIAKGRIVALLGSNGAGKTTLMNAIAGALKPQRGSIEFDGASIAGQPAHRIFMKGLSLVPQGRKLFPEMTVRENIELGALSVASQADLDARISAMLALFPRLHERLQQRAGGLSGGEQQMLATARALVSQPKLLLLDEPTTGLAPLIVAELTRTLRKLKDAGQTILLVEQNVRMALALADYVYLMRVGTIVHAAPAAELRGDDAVFKSYFG